MTALVSLLFIAMIPIDCKITIFPYILVISKLVSRKNPLNKNFLKFHNYLMEGFRIDLKTFLDLAMPNNYSQTVRK